MESVIGVQGKLTKRSMGYGVGMHVIRGTGAERDVLTREAGTVSTGRQDDRHAAASRRDRRIGGGGEDGAGLDGIAGFRTEERPVCAAPSGTVQRSPGAGEREGSTIADAGFTCRQHQRVTRIDQGNFHQCTMLPAGRFGPEFGGVHERDRPRQPFPNGQGPDRPQ